MAYSVLLCTTSGDSPANLQGGLIVGCILMRLLAPLCEAVAIGVESGWRRLGWVHAAPVLVLLYPLASERGKALYATSFVICMRLI